MANFADANGYELLMGRWSRRLGREFVAQLELADGASVLDVGCGTGAFTAAVLDAAQPERVVGIDPSPAFVELARANLRDPRVRFETGDALHLGFPDAHFGCTAAMIALNFVGEPARAAAEMRRVTAPGGRVAACVWDYGGDMTLLRAFWDAASALDPAAESLHERHMPLCRAGELAELWRTGGLLEVRERPLVIETVFANFDDYWRPFTSGVGPSGAYAMSLAAPRRQALQARLCSVLWDDRPDEARRFPARAWAVTGRVPPGLEVSSGRPLT